MQAVAFWETGHGELMGMMAAMAYSVFGCKASLGCYCVASMLFWER